jgi:tetratricopeptide (TPR) repeat protein
MKPMQWGLTMVLGAALLTAQTKVPADDANDRGLAATSRGDYKEAERLLRESVSLWQAMGPEYEGHASIAMMNLAEAMCGAGRWRDGAALLTKSLEMSRHSLGNQHIRTVSNMNFLASADLVLGDLEAANTLYHEALSVEREHYTNTTEMADTLMGISSYLVRSNRLAEALAPAEEGLEVALKAAGENSIDSAMAYANVAQIHTFAHRPDRAIPLFRKAETIYARVLSTEHPRYASVLSQEGLALMLDHKRALAASNMTRAVEILSRCSSCQYQAALAKSNLGWLRYQEGKYHEADAMLTQALTLQESYLGHPGSEMAATLNRLAEVRRKEQRYSDAEQLHDRAVTLQSYR